MPKVLISDSLSEQGVKILEQAPGIELVNRPGCSPAELLELADGLGVPARHVDLELGPLSAAVAGAAVLINTVPADAAAPFAPAVAPTPFAPVVPPLV